MKRLIALSSLLTLAACGGEAPAPEAPPPPAPSPPAAVAEAPPPPAAPEPTEEEKKRAAAAEALAKDRAKLQADLAAEKERLTPELREEAAKAVAASYPSLDAAMKKLLVAKYRQPANAARDGFRHPLETLKFFGVTPKSRVLEHSPGTGWYTELLAPLLAKSGKLTVTIGDVQGPAESRGTFYAQQLAGYLDVNPELYGKVERLRIDPSALSFGDEPRFDVILALRVMHGMVNGKSLEQFLAAAFKALAPGGTLGVVQHRAAADAKVEESSPKGYLPEAFVIAQVEAAGFKLAGKSEVNANPKDTKDYAEGVWALPPTLRGGETDRARFVAIGESDRMTLRFTKPKK